MAVPSTLVGLSRSTGRGKLWTNLLDELGQWVVLQVVNSGPRPGPALRRRRPDVWLADGHQGPLGVEEPTAALILEAAWEDPVTRHLLDPQFVEAHEGPSQAGAGAATLVVTPSESSRRQVIGAYKLDPARVRAVPLGVDSEVFRPGRPGGPAMVATRAGGLESPYVVYVSSLHPRKNLAALRNAVVLLAAQGLPHHLVVVFAPAPDRLDSTELEKEALAELPGWPGRVHGLSQLSEVELAAVMAGADVFCLPSLMEGFGLSALEAMACGVPVVVANRGALPEVVGDAGLVAEPTAEDLAEAMAAVLTDPGRRSTLARAARRRAEGFSWAATAAAWADALEEAASAGSR